MIKFVEDINETIFEQYENIRQSGLTNMYNMYNVLKIAESCGYYELIDFVSGDTKNYMKILKNYSKAIELGIIHVGKDT